MRVDADYYGSLGPEPGDRPSLWCGRCGDFAYHFTRNHPGWLSYAEELFEAARADRLSAKPKTERETAFEDWCWNNFERLRDALRATTPKGEGSPVSDPAAQIILKMRAMNACFYTASYEGEETGATTCAVVAVDDSIYAVRLLAFMAEMEREEPTETTLVPEPSVLPAQKAGPA